MRNDQYSFDATIADMIKANEHLSAQLHEQLRNVIAIGEAIDALEWKMIDSLGAADHPGRFAIYYGSLSEVRRSLSPFRAKLSELIAEIECTIAERRKAMVR